jgi:hypothetical protein
MILDKQLLFMDNGAFGDTPAVLNLGNTFRPEGAIGDIKGRVVCAAGDAAGTTALVLKTGTTAGGASTTIATYPMTHTQMNKGFNFVVPPDNLKQYLTIAFTGISAGTKITAGLVLDTQTA